MNCPICSHDVGSVYEHQEFHNVPSSTKYESAHGNMITARFHPLKTVVVVYECPNCESIWNYDTKGRKLSLVRKGDLPRNSPVEGVYE